MTLYDDTFWNSLPEACFVLEGYPRTPDSSEGLIPRATICYMGIDPYVIFFEHQD